MTEDQILQRAAKILLKRIQNEPVLNSPDTVREYLKCLLSGEEHEVFLAIFLDAQNRVLCSEELFRGTLAIAYACCPETATT